MAAMMVAGLVAGVSSDAQAQSISGSVRNQSSWDDLLDINSPPGDGDGMGDIIIGLWNNNGSIDGYPAASITLRSGVVLPDTFNTNYPYAFGWQQAASYQVLAWIDANTNGQYDIGEPRSTAKVATPDGMHDIVGFNLVITDDSDNDGLPDYWEAHWFKGSKDPLGFGAKDDPDNDGLTNERELVEGTNPADWDTDNDGMDDAYEVKYKGVAGNGLNPVVFDALPDIDGDGLSNYQEYVGVDGIAPMVTEKTQNGIRVAKHNNTADTLNPLDIDTDFDLLVDSFEAAWFDPANGIDPAFGILTAAPTNGVYDLSIAMADPDQDGLSNYREQCLLKSFRQDGVNSNMWLWLKGSFPVPFPFLTYETADHQIVRECMLGGTWGGQALTTNFPGMNFGLPTLAFGNRSALRDASLGWTDPTDGSGYNLVDENIPAGHDTDNDGLPDGWEVEFGLDARDPTGSNGAFGDPDGDDLLNYEEFLGQDGNRSATKPYVNGSGDETNPNVHNARPDTTYAWRWLLTNAIVAPITDPRVGLGINRNETIGSALPSHSIWADSGFDTDDDGIPDAQEINPPDGTAPSSPVHSTDPFIMRSVLITSTNGIVIPDPEPTSTNGDMPAGIRRDLQRRDWTIECLVKPLDTGLNGQIFGFNTAAGTKSRLIYRLELVNNAPVLSAQINGSLQVVTGNPLPTNKWTHLAAMWDHQNNSLGLYIQGVLFVGKSAFGESASTLTFPATNVLAFGASSGSFVNKLMLDEIRIWGLARTGQQISDFAYRLLPQNNGDDVWISSTPGGSYYRTNDALLVNGGALYEGEVGTPLTNVLVNGGNYWIDDGNGIYQSSFDVLLYRGSSPIVEGAIGTAVGNVRYNDKDASGGYTRDSLLAYYRFDDGGTTAEDFARKAKNSLKDATSENYFFGDFAYALPSSGFSLMTAGAANVLGVDRRASDDTDGDGLPDAWEVVYHLNPFDNGAGGETDLGAMDGLFGAMGDVDQDQLKNIYEFWSQTNPRSVDSDGNGTPDAQEDLDGDGVVNLTEQLLGSRPDMDDTDDDGLADNTEQGNVTSPIDPLDPPQSRAVHLGGDTSDYLEVPLSFKQRLINWTLEALVNPDTVASGVGTVVRRVVQDLGGGSSNALNYVLGIETNVLGGLNAYAGFIQPSGAQSMLHGGSIPATGSYTHVAATYDNSTATMILYVNGVGVATNKTFSLAPPVNGKGGESFVRIGEHFGGSLDEVRIWNVARLPIQILTNAARTVSFPDTTLVHYFRFDDGQATNDVLPFSTYNQPAGAQDFTFAADWNQQWRHAAKISGNVNVILPGGIIPPSSLRINLFPADALALGAQWSVDGGAFHDSGISLDLAPGPHSVLYKSIFGWTSPTNETVVLGTGTITTLNRTYRQNGALIVNLEPAAAIASGAQFRLDGGSFVDSGTIITNLAPGLHSLDFSTISGWSAPTNEVVTVGEASTTSLTRTYSQAVIVPVKLVVNDFDGDGASDLSVYQPSSGKWFIRLSSDGSTNVQSWGTSSMTPVPADYDGDGITDFAVRNPKDGIWYIIDSSSKAPRWVHWAWGSSTMKPVPADYDGDHKADVAIYHQSIGNWYILFSKSGDRVTTNWGWSAASPAPGDYDGDGRADLAVYWPQGGFWYIVSSITGQIYKGKPLQWGWKNSIPVPGDYDGDLKTDLAVYQPSTAKWYVQKSSDGLMLGGAPIQWGPANATPMAGDYDNDGITDIAVYYQKTGKWYVRKSSDGLLLGGGAILWGSSSKIAPHAP